MVRKLLLGFILIIFLWILWVGFFNRYNTYVNISDYPGLEKPYDITIVIDNKKIINDLIDTTRHSYYSNIYPIRINSGKHKICVRSEKLAISDSLIFFSMLYSKIYIEIIKNDNESKHYISIDKRFGKRFVFE